MTPQELVTAAQQGNHNAFADLWRLYQPEVQRFAYARTGDHHAAEDITSEAFLRAWRGIGGFVWQGKGFAGWVFTIVRNLVFDHYKSRHTQLSRPVGISGDEWRNPDTDRRGDPASVAAHADLAEALDASLAALTSQQRQVLALRFGAGLPIEDVAAALGLQKSAVKSSQHRATQTLRRHPALVALEVAA